MKINFREIIIKFLIDLGMIERNIIVCDGCGRKKEIEINKGEDLKDAILK